MKLGFLTACLPQVSLEELVPWAARQGFETLELAAWHYDSDRDYQARHIEAENLARGEAEQITNLFDENGLEISALAYYENNIHPDKAKRDTYLTHLRSLILAAELLGVELVGAFVGANPEKSPAENMKEIGGLFRELVSYAEDHGVRLMIENCPMDNWVQFGLPGNYAYSPELWDALFNEVPDENFGLNFDPSHLHWLGIDYNKAARDFSDRIFHAHAKDAEIVGEGLYRYGILSKQLGDDPWDLGWWRYRMPGKGEVDWREFIATLHDAGYDKVLSIEHEDPEFEGSVEEIREGLRLGLEHLQMAMGCGRWTTDHRP